MTFPRSSSAASGFNRSISTGSTFTTKTTTSRKSFHDMGCIPESPPGSPVFYRSTSQLRMGATTRMYPGRQDLSDHLLTDSIQNLESGLLKVCNAEYMKSLSWKEAEVSSRRMSNEMPPLPDRFIPLDTGFTKYPILKDNDNLSDSDSLGSMSLPTSPERKQFRSTLNLNLHQGRLKPEETRGDVISTDDPKCQFTLWSSNDDGSVSRGESRDQNSTEIKSSCEDDKCSAEQVDDIHIEEDIKTTIGWIRHHVTRLRADDRKLLKQFVQIRFGMETLSAQLLNWTRTTSLSSCRDLSILGTLPRSPIEGPGDGTAPVFRKRAHSLRTPQLDITTFSWKYT